MSGEKKEKPFDALWRLCSAARLYRSMDGRLHASVPIGDRSETIPINSVGFRRWLTNRSFVDSGQPPSPGAIRRVISLLEARAWLDGDTPSVFIRVGCEPGGDDAAYFLDLGDASGRAVWICADGWCVVEKPGVHFRRPDGLLALPVPSVGGSIDLLRPYVNVCATDFQLLITWLTSALRPVGPYPILVLHGEQGAAKTSLVKTLRLLVDPQACPILADPKNPRDLMVTAVNGWLLAYDNVSSISNDMSDGFCRLVSGGGIATRALFSNEELSVLYAQRPVILSGIEEFVARGDLIDRCVFIHLESIQPDRRRTEADSWKAFHADYPRILGGILDAVAGALRELPSVHLRELPRMADYAKWGEAVSRALRWNSGAFLSTYRSNRREATMPALVDSPVAAALCDMASILQDRRWQGRTPAELFAQLTHFVDQTTAASVRDLNFGEARKILAASAVGWPRDPQSFAKELRRVAPMLRLHGLSVDFQRTNQGRRVFFTYNDIPVDELEDDEPEPCSVASPSTT
jgi:hypothetical protein